MKDKFNMTVKENVFVAKRVIVDSIWKSANLEGIAVTYPETEAIYDGLSIEGMKVNDIIAINNLKRGWEFILSHTDYETDYNFILAVHSFVGGDGLINHAGYIRGIDVNIGGTNWKPSIPNEDEIKLKTTEIIKDKNKPVTERAIDLMLHLMRTQAFYDGNKRTSTLVANHLMISNGKGIISIPNDVHLQFRDLLIEFYETNDKRQIKKLIYDYGVNGIDFSSEKIRKGRNLRDIRLTKKNNNELER